MSRQNESPSKLSVGNPFSAASVESPSHQGLEIDTKQPPLADEIGLAISSSIVQFAARLKERDDECASLYDQIGLQMDELVDDVRVAKFLSHRHRSRGNKQINKLHISIGKLAAEHDRSVHRVRQLGQKLRQMRAAWDQGQLPPALLLQLGQFKEGKLVQDASVEMWRLMVEMSSTSKRLHELRASLNRMEAEVQYLSVTDLCLAGRPDKAKISFRMHLAKRLERLSEMKIAMGFQKKALTERELRAATRPPHEDPESSRPRGAPSS